MNKDFEKKLNDNFGDMLVYKNLQKSNFFDTIGLPSFMRDWVVKKFQDDKGNINTEEVSKFVKKYIPKKEDWLPIKNQIVMEGEEVQFLAKVGVDIAIRDKSVHFSLPDFGLSFADTIIEDDVWEDVKFDMLKQDEGWGMVKLGYMSPEELDAYEEYKERTSIILPSTLKTGHSQKKQKNKVGKIKLISYKPYCPYNIDIDYYKETSKNFTFNEWLDILLGAVDYNGEGYKDTEYKLTMLTRLLPFVEKRLNLIELAPKGTGKSYLYGRVSRFGWLSSGGVMSRAKLFYDIGKKREGLIIGNDFITFDEVQTISFSDVDEMRAALKGYLESGIFTVANHEGKADAGIILCGNISKEVMDGNGYENMFIDLPEIFYESALIDRFHGFIKGWNIPRMNDDLKMQGLALNSEYFTSIIHSLRNDLSYRAIVDELIEVQDNADTRDTEAIKRISTAYLKLFFPYVKNAKDVDINKFDTYCLGRAKNMRETILYQLGLMDSEYKGKNIPDLKVKR